MTEAARKILEGFEDLDEKDRQEVGVAILERIEVWNSAPLSDGELDLAAESIFLELDAQECCGQA